MGIELNGKAIAHAQSLIAAGKVDKTVGGWSISAAEENAMLGDPPDWDEYSKWFLGRDPDENPDTKGAWKYPTGKGGKVHRGALIGDRQRAGQFHAEAIFEAAGRLIREIDGSGEKNYGEADPAPFEIFRAGRHTASDGAVIDFSAADLGLAARAYDPAIHEAPLVVGHPRTDDPAYGWVKGLRSDGSSLIAAPHQVDSAFAELVRSGRFKKISASFYTPESPQNPAPGTYYLRHVGFLGAQPPALKGLKPVAFADGGEGLIEFDIAIERRVGMQRGAEFHEAGLRKVVHHLRRVREHILRKHGKEEADATVPEEHLQELEDEARLEGEEERSREEAPRGRGTGMMAGGAAAYAEGGRRVVVSTSPEIEKKIADLQRREAEFAEKMRALEVRERAAIHERNVAFYERLEKEGRMLPANRALAVAVLDFAASADKPATIEFGEGAEKKSMFIADSIKLLLSSQPKVVTYREVAHAGEGGEDTEEATKERMIAEFMEKHKGASYRDALLEVSKTAPHLFGLAVKPKQQ